MGFFPINSDLYKLICPNDFCSSHSGCSDCGIELEDSGVIDGKGCNKVGNYKDGLQSRFFWGGVSKAVHSLDPHKLS